jgi:thiamine-monophosphate kinase
MMDLSDGLSSDLARLCAASGVGARVDADRLPRVLIPRQFARRLGKRADPLRMALHGGDDYELLFTVPAKMIGKLQGAPGFRSFRAIGEIQRGSGVALLGPDGKTTALVPGGWDPFRT